MQFLNVETTETKGGVRTEAVAVRTYHVLVIGTALLRVAFGNGDEFRLSGPLTSLWSFYVKLVLGSCRRRSQHHDHQSGRFRRRISAERYG